jgi:retron-type reverse transcriptase
MAGHACTLSDQILMDDGEFKSCSYQRVYQYIRRFTAGQKLDNFSYPGTVEGTPQNCVEQLLQ